MSEHKYRVAAILLLAAVTAGCGKWTATAEGLVTLDGQPLTHGTVTFHPQNGGAAGYGEIAANGLYSVRSGGSNGLQPGAYDVTVVALEPAILPTDPQGMPMPGKRITPARYSSVQTSDLKADVKAGANQIDFPLSKAPPSP